VRGGVDRFRDLEGRKLGLWGEGSINKGRKRREGRGDEEA